MQDNASPLRSACSKKWLKNNHINMLKWPQFTQLMSKVKMSKVKTPKVKMLKVKMPTVKNIEKQYVER